MKFGFNVICEPVLNELRRESTWSIICDVIWLILNLLLNIFDLTGTQGFTLFLKVHLKEDHIGQQAGHFRSP